MPADDSFIERIQSKHFQHFLINKNTFVGHVVTVGDIGMAKSSINSRICELDYENGFKVFELHTDASRMDNAFWSFPSDVPFWQIPKVENGKIIAKKSYPMSLLYPISKKTPSKLPVVANLFTIPLNSLDEYDFAALIGADISDSIRQLWNILQPQIKKSTTPNDFVNMLTDIIKSNKKNDDDIKPAWQGAATLKYNIMTPLTTEGIVSSANCETAIDLLEELRDRDRISVLCLRHIPKPLIGFIVHWFINHINILSKQYGIKAVIKLNEAPDILRKPEMGATSASIAISNQIGSIFKQGRTSNLYFRLDCQDPKELPEIKNTATTVIVCRTSYLQDVKEMTGFSTKTGAITQDEFLCIPFQKQGQAFIFRRDDEKVKWVKFMWCRHRMWRTGEEFYKMWDKLDGRWKDVRKELKFVKAEIESSENKWKDKRELDKMREAKKRQIAKDNAERQRQERLHKEERDKEERRLKREVERARTKKAKEVSSEKSELEQLDDEIGSNNTAKSSQNKPINAVIESQSDDDEDILTDDLF
jgi:hypothetical protein